MKISPARKAAYEILRRIEAEHAFSSALLPSYAESLNEPDKGLAYAIVLGVLRRRALLDRHIDVLANKKKTDIEVRIILRIGLFQLLFLSRIPHHSIVNESVLITQAARKTSAKGFVNAILRRAIRGLEPLEYENDKERLIIENSVPEWLFSRWERQFGPDRTSSIISSFSNTQKVSFRLTAKALVSNDITSNVTEAVKTHALPSDILDGAYSAERITPMLRQLSDDGLIYFQDVGSQLIASAVNVPQKASFLDLCAAPGGKLTMVAMKAAVRGIDSGLIAGGEFHSSRAKLLQENCIKQGCGNVRIVQLDARSSLPFEDNYFDVVLVDAPCSGTGTIGHNPEIRYFLDEKDISDLQRKQLDILRNASKVLKPGGRLIYSTCSLEREENEDVAREFLLGNNEFLPVPANVPKRFLTEQGSGRIFPGDEASDGFFIFEAERRSKP